MTATMIDGKKIAQTRREQVAEAVHQLREQGGLQPKLAVILVGDDAASATYVNAKAKACAEVGFDSEKILLPKNTSKDKLMSEIDRLNKDNSVNGILLQLPIPEALQPHKTELINAIAPAKDVDGFHPDNVGQMILRQGGVTPCTPKGCLILLKEALGENGLSGKKATVIGRSDIVGNPMAQLLQQQGCTVTVCHSKTGEAVTKQAALNADILVAAAGRPEMVKADWVKKGACVIDVGIHPKLGEDGKPVINPETGRAKLTGDVDFESVKEVAGYITPVPGGVGPMTIACLLENTLEAYRRQQKSMNQAALSASA